MMGRVGIGVAGVTYEGRQAVLARLYHAQSAGAVVEARLVREPANRYDPNAICVQVDARGMETVMEPVMERMVGYIPRALAVQWAPSLDAGCWARVASVHISCGGEPTVYGARLQVEIDTSGEKGGGA